MDYVFFEELERGTHIQCPKELVGIRIGGALTKKTDKDADSSRSLTRLRRKLLLPLLMLKRLFVADALLARIIHTGPPELPKLSLRSRKANPRKVV
jgi:hypothetical protein